MDSTTEGNDGSEFSKLSTHLITSLKLAQSSLKHPYPPNIGENHLESYDFIIVGSGSSGSPLAAKLSSNPNWNILLIEAGDDPTMDSEVPRFYFSLEGENRKEDWGYKTVPQENGCLALINHQSFWTRGRMLGGCSSTNAMMYQEGNECDYNDWEEKANHGWGYKDVEDYFKYLRENIASEPTLLEPKSLEKLENSIKLGMNQLGYNTIEDDILKSSGTIGAFHSLKTIKNGERINTAKYYLQETKDKTNFHLLKNAHVKKILTSSKTKQVEGVELVYNGEVRQILVRKEVILSAGAINSPQLLILSGIGNKKTLHDLNIPLIAELPVGDNLIDHSKTMVYSKIDIELEDNSFNDKLNNIYEYLKHRKGPLNSSGNLEGLMCFVNTKDSSKYPDVQFLFGLIPKNTQGLSTYYKTVRLKPEYSQKIIEENKHHHLLVMLIILLKPKSRGTIGIDSNGQPVIDPKYMSDEDDLKTNVSALKILKKFIQTEEMKKYNIQLIPFNFENFNKLSNDPDEYDKCLVKHFSSTLYHPVGTAKMSPGADGVVDCRLKVKGVKGLRVADASIMPDIVSGNTNAPCIMIGLKMGDMILEDYKQ